MDVINSPLESTSDIWLELGVRKTQASLVVAALVVKKQPANAGDLRDVGSNHRSGRSPGGGMATHSNILAWRIPWTEDPGGLQSTGCQTVGHD